MNTLNSKRDLDFNLGEDVDRIINGFKEDLERIDYYKNEVLDELRYEVLCNRNVEYKYEYCMDELEAELLDGDEVIYYLNSVNNKLEVRVNMMFNGNNWIGGGTIDEDNNGYDIRGLWNEKQIIDHILKIAKYHSVRVNKK